jgi:hypothetical protein
MPVFDSTNKSSVKHSSSFCLALLLRIRFDKVLSGSLDVSVELFIILPVLIISLGLDF